VADGPEEHGLMSVASVWGFALVGIDAVPVRWKPMPGMDFPA
jgi:hypothetical protein